MKKMMLLWVALLTCVFYTNAQTYNATVAKDGSGTHTTVAAAIQSAPTNSSTPYYILVKNGVYNEKDTVPTNRTNIVMVGESVLNTVIYYNDNANTLFNGSPIGTSGSACFFVNGANFTAFNLTFQNNSGVAAGQAVAVNISGDKAAFRNCRFLGFQDVLYCKNSGISSYFYNCYIEGTVDFIFGASTSWFENCYIYCKNRTSGGIVTAPNTAAGTSFGSPWGFVFNNCKVNGASSMTGLYYLGRPWQNKPQSVFLNTSMSGVINAAGWSSNSAGAATTSDVSFGEYNNSGTGANAGSRSATFATMLSSTQAANYTLSNVLGSWDPCSVTNVCNSLDFPVATANFTGSQTSNTSASFGWNMCWPVAMNYTIKRSNNGGAYTTVGTTTGTSSEFNYTTADNSMPTGLNKYILEMSYNSVTYTSTDTITISNQPTLTANVTSLSAFTQTIGTPSFQQTFTISGANLTNDITINAPTNFQVSSNGSTWANSFTITQSGGSVSATTVYVRLNAGANGTYTGNVDCSTTGGSTVSVAVSGTTSSAPAYVASLLQQWPLTSSGTDSSAVRAVGINSSTYTGNKLFVSNNATTPAFPPYSGTYGLAFGPSTTTTSSGLWTAANNGPAGNLSRIHYLQFTISGQSGYGVRIDSLILASAFYNTSSSTKLAVVYSKSGFASDSTDITSGGTLAGTALGSTAYGAFANPIALANQTGGPTNIYRLPLNGSTGVTLTSGQTLTVRLYFSCSSTGSPRHAFLKNVQAKGSVTAPAPTITSFTPTSQVSGGSVVINGTNFSNVTAVTFGGANASSYTVNSGTQITAVVGNGSSGDISVTTASGTATLSGFTYQTPTTYYNIPGTDVTSVNSWGTNTDGTGAHPNNFTDNLQTFKIYNSGATMSGAWTVSGSNSKISVNSNSGVFNVTQTIIGTVDVENDADIEIKTASAPTFGNLQAGSTVGYSGTIDQAITATNYSNLVLNGSGLRTFPASLVGISGQFTTNSYVAANSGSIISFNGTSPQTLPSFTFDSLIISNTNGVTTQGGAVNIVVNKGLNIAQNFTIDAGDNVQLSSANGVAFTVASGKTLTVNGTLDNQSAGTATWGALSSSSSSSTASNADSARFVVNSGGVYKINALVSNAYYIAVGTFKSGSTIQIQQGSPRIPVYVGGNVTWNSAGVGTLIQQASSTIAGNLTVNAGQLNNGAGGTARTLNIQGKLIVAGGEYEPAGSGNTAAQVVNVFNDIEVSGGSLYATLSTTGGTGTINAYKNITHTGGNFGVPSNTVVGSSLTLLGTTTKSITTTGFANNINLTLNNAAGATINNDVTVGNLTLTSGILTTAGKTITVKGVITRGSLSWVNGGLQKTITTGSNITTDFEIGDATNYIPVSFTFASVSAAGDIKVSTGTPISNVANFGSAYVSPIDYINRYWNIASVGALSFNNYSVVLNYKAGDITGSATSSSVLGYVYNSAWNVQSTTSGTNANTLTNVTAIGNIIIGNDCTPVTPSLSIATASATVCSANSVIFTTTSVNPGTAPVYQWKKNGVNIATGNTLTLSASSLVSGDKISCTLTANNICQTTATANSNVITMTVQQSPVVPTITTQYGNNTTSFSMCTIGGKVSVYPSPAFGVWSSTSNGSVSQVARLNSTSYSADVTAIQNGTDTVKYTLTTPGTICSSVAAIVVNVAQQAMPNPITGASSLCVGSSTTYTTTSTGGAWGTLGRATITNTGIATGTSAGATSIKYTITNVYGCSASATLPITVNALPAVPSIAFASGTTGVTGSGGYCKNKTFTLVGTPSGGSWSSSGVISVSGTGVVNTGSVTGACSVTYSVTNANGCANSRTISANIVSCGSKGTSSSTNINEQLVIFPNPAKSLCTIKVERFTGSGTIVVTNLYGKQVKQQSLSLGNNSIDLTGFAKGVYFVSTITELGKQTQKLIVE